MGPQGETDGCGKGQTDWVDVLLTGKPADGYVSGNSMYFANGSLVGASISTPTRLYDYMAMYRGLSWRVWCGIPSNYKYLVDAPDFGR